MNKSSLKNTENPQPSYKNTGNKITIGEKECVIYEYNGNTYVKSMVPLAFAQQQARDFACEVDGKSSIR